jgi:pyroglutamyl-peptidase
MSPKHPSFIVRYLPVGFALSLLLIVLILLPLRPWVHADAKHIVMFTHFDPFGGASVNQSEQVAQALKSLPFQNVELKICKIHTIYDQAADEAMNCVEALQADGNSIDLVVSLGEGDCSLRVEKYAHNLDHAVGFADNAGNIRVNQTIIPGEPQEIELGLNTELLLNRLSSSERGQVRRSLSAGSFVCNNTAFHLMTELKKQSIPYGFIHVPNHGCSPAQKNPQNNARLIRKMLAY